MPLVFLGKVRDKSLGGSAAIVASELAGQSCIGPKEQWGVWLVALRVALSSLLCRFLKKLNLYLKLLWHRDNQLYTGIWFESEAK